MLRKKREQTADFTPCVGHVGDEGMCIKYADGDTWWMQALDVTLKYEEVGTGLEVRGPYSDGRYYDLDALDSLTVQVVDASSFVVTLRRWSVSDDITVGGAVILYANDAYGASVRVDHLLFGTEVLTFVPPEHHGGEIHWGFGYSTPTLPLTVKIKRL
jgi:hypothetical protein